jgi:pimeloyl-ACP methyl ester carboxylesterase
MKRKESVWVSMFLLLILSVVILKASSATADGMNIEKGYAIASDGTKIYFEVHGKGPFLFLGPPLTASPIPNQATPIADAYIKELPGKYRVIVADYPRGYGKTPAPNPVTVTGDSVTLDLLAIADAAGAEKFAWFGFSWGGVVGLQLAHLTDRLVAFICGGWPPLGAPYDKMREVTQKMVNEWPYGEESKAYKAMPVQILSSPSYVTSLIQPSR